MSESVDQRLAEFDAGDVTYRLIDGVFGVIPGAQPLSEDRTLQAVGERLGATPQQIAAARRIAATEDGIRDILWMSRLIDTGDKGYAIFTGVSSAVKLFWGSDDDDDDGDGDAKARAKADAKAAARAQAAAATQQRQHQGRRRGRRPRGKAKAKAYAKRQWRHQMRRYKELLHAQQTGRLHPTERQELRHLQQMIRQEMERREASGQPTPRRRRMRRGPGGGGRRRFPGGPRRRRRQNRPGAPAWASMPEDDFGADFEEKFEDYEETHEEDDSWAEGLAALETDPQQRNDAILKALAIAYMAHRAFPGSLTERAQRFVNSPAGESLLVYYAAVEVGLPFADNALLSGGKMVDSLIGDQVDTQLARLGQMASGRSLGETAGMLQQLTGWMQSAVGVVSPYIDSIANGAQQYLPISANVTDKLTGLAANAADVMPCYRLLGARLAAEAAILRAMS